MTKKNTSRTLKKVMTGFVVFNVFASSFLTALPTISSATENSEGQVSRPNLRASSTNLLKNWQFSSTGGVLTDWDFVYAHDYSIANARITPYTPVTGSDGWFYNQSTNPFAGVKPMGDRSVQLKARTDWANTMSYVRQSVDTVSGNLYTIKFNATINSISQTGDATPWIGSVAKNRNESAFLGYTYATGNLTNKTIDFIATDAQTDILFGGGVDSAKNDREAIILVKDVSLVDNSTTIDRLTNASNVVTGTGYPGQVVIISNGSNELGRVTTNPTTGVYSLNILPQAKGSTVTAIVSKEGKTSRASTTVANDRIAQTTINEIYNDDTQISGTAEERSHVVIRNASNVIIAEGNASATGTYQFNISPQAMGTTITVTASAYEQVSSANTVVKGVPAPQVNPVSDVQTQVTGEGEAGFNITVTIGGNSYTGVASANGEFAVTIPRQEAGTKIDVKQTNPTNHKVSPIREVTVSDTTLAKPVIEPIAAGATSVIITGVPGAAIDFTDQNGDVSRKTANATGRATFYIETAQLNDVFSATQTGENNKASERATYTVRDTSTPNAPEVNPVSDIQTQVTGTGAANHAIRVTINGVTYNGTVNGSGAYTVAIPRQEAGTTIDVTQVNPNNGNVSPKRTVIVSDTTLGAPEILGINVGATQVTVKGQPNASVKLKLPSGSEINAVANSQGNAVFTVTATRIGDVFEATQTGANGKASPKDTFTVVDTRTPNAPQVNPVNDVQTQVNGTAEPNHTVTVTIDGSTYTGTANGSGSYTILIPKQDAGTKIDVTQTNPNNGNVSPKQTVTVSDTTLVAPKISDVKVGDTQVTVTGTPGARITLTLPGGSQPSIVADGTGKAIFFVLPAKMGDAYEATQTGANGKASPKDTFTVSDTTTPNAPTVNPVSDVQTQVTGTGQPNYAITITINGATYTGTTNGSGAYSITIPKQQSGTKIDVTQTNPANGNVSPKQTVTVSDTTLVAPKISDVKVGDTQVTVTGTAGARITLTLPGGSKPSIVADGTGKAMFNVPSAQAGDVYEATQTGANGKASPKDAFTVTDTTTPNAPTVNPVSDVQTQVNGIAEPNYNVTLTINGATYTGTANGSGAYTILIPKQNAGTKIDVTQTNPNNGNVSPKQTVTVSDTTLVAPKISDVKVGDTQVTVTGTAGARITLTLPGGSKPSIVADGIGKAIFNVPSAQVGDVYEATQTGANGKASPKDAFIVTDTTTPNAPTVNPVSDVQTQVTGTAVANHEVTVTINGTTYTGTANGSGAYAITIPKQQSGTKIDVTQTNPNNGNVSPKQTVTVSDTTLNAPTISEITENNTQVTVTGQPNTNITLVLPSGSKISLVSDSTGKAIFTIPAAQENTTYQAYQTGANGKASPNASAAVKSLPKTGTISANEFTIGVDKNVTGSYTGDIKSVRLIYDGVEYRGGSVASGSYSFYALNTIKDKTKTAKMYGYDKNGVKIAETIVSLRDTRDSGGIGKGTITANDFTINRDKNVTGTFTGDVVAIGLVYDGTEYRGGTVSNGTYSFYALNTIKDKTKTAKMYGYDRNGNRIATAAIALRDANDSSGGIGTGTITASEFMIHRDKSITGTYTGDVVSIGLVYDGTEYRGGTVSNGSYSFYALNTVTDKTKTATIYGYDRNGNRIATAAVSLRDAKDETVGGTGTVTADNFAIGTSRNITGRFTGDVKSLIVKVGSTEYAGGSLDKTTGTYSFYAWDKINSVSDDVTVYGLNQQGSRIATAPVTITKPSTSGTITPHEFVVGQDRNLTATYTGDVRRGVVIINNVEHTGGTVSNGNVNFYIGNKILSKNDTVKIAAYDAYNQLLQEKIVTLRDVSDNTTGTITPNLFVAGQDSDITASYTGDVRSVRVTINNQVYTGGALSNGTATFWIGDKITSSGDEVFISAYDLNGKKLDEKPVEIRNINGDIHPDEYTVRKDTVLTANVTSAVRSVKVVINGVEYLGGTISEGRLSFWIGDKIKDSKDVVRIFAYDKNGRELENKAVVLKDVTPEVGTITPSVFSIKTSGVRGTYTGDGRSIRLTVNGTVLPAGGTVSGGNFSYYVGLQDKIRSTSDIVKVELLDRYGLVMDSQNLTIIN
ncbi:immunoglobulin-like domain-containing protein [Listeria fleischmannii]|uniref:Cell wall-associated protease n=1 Tax=Listeria fleischmannii TaxID=1069827 RepID=A0A841YE75_9LIST|nr:immunoglobulin-like domain-containing protein [Listeria fleischmannii]MBC1398561.1 hypothetical protein [Listeria fleischmannii]MBC1426622.1 hypothetical protein [Listeria fleischmannii]